MIFYAIMAACIVIADFAIKFFIKNNVPLNSVFASIPGIADFTYVQNKGAAFSMFYGRVSVLSIISVVFCIAVIVYWIVKKPKNVLMRTSSALMLAGALGNAIDRIAYGYVVDFIEVSFINFPVFNIADIAITAGAAIMIIKVIFFDKEEKS